MTQHSKELGALFARMRWVDVGSSRVPPEPSAVAGRSPVSTTAVVTEQRALHGGRNHPASGTSASRITRCSCSATSAGRGAEEFDIACRVAHAAAREGVNVGDRIAFLDRNGMAYFDFLFGGSLIGAVNVAVNWRLAPSEMAAIIDDSQAPCVGRSHRLPRHPGRHAGWPARRASDRGDRRRRRVAQCSDPTIGSVREVDRRVSSRTTPVMSERTTRSACSSTPPAPRDCRRASC